MNIVIKCTNISLTDAIRDYINNKVSVLNKFVASPDTVCHVEVGKTTAHHKHGDVFRAEIRIIVDGQEYYVTSEKEDLYQAIDYVKEDVFNRIVSRKEKRQTFFKRSGAKLKNMLRGVMGKDINGQN